MQIDRLDHLVLTVRDLDATRDFYARVLGMEVVMFEGGRIALRFGQQKINLHLAGKEFKPKALHPVPGSADLCLITRASSEAVRAHLRGCGVAIELGPVARTGALGTMRSVYCRDPDGNLIEVATYEDQPAPR